MKYQFLADLFGVPLNKVIENLELDLKVVPRCFEMWLGKCANVGTIGA